MKKTYRLPEFLLVVTAFYVLGMAVIGGIVTDYVEKDLNFGPATLRVLPYLVFIWLALASLPAARYQSMKGKRLTLAWGAVITALGMIIPFIYYSTALVFTGLSVAGIGIAVMLVSAAPLLIRLSDTRHQAANLSLAGLVAAIAFTISPLVASAFLFSTGKWQWIFPVYAGFSLVVATWLFTAAIDETKPVKPAAGFLRMVTLLKKPRVALLIIGTFLCWGFIPALNLDLADFLLHRFPITTETAGSGARLLIAGLVTGLFTGSIFLRTTRLRDFLYGSILITLLGLTGIMVTREINLARIMIFFTGLGFANIIPVLFTMIIRLMPQHDNELSALIVISGLGGAILPLLMACYCRCTRCLRRLCSSRW